MDPNGFNGDIWDAYRKLDLVLTDNWRTATPMTHVPREYRVGETITVKLPKRFTKAAD